MSTHEHQKLFFAFSQRIAPSIQYSILKMCHGLRDTGIPPSEGEPIRIKIKNANVRELFVIGLSNPITDKQLNAGESA